MEDIQDFLCLPNALSDERWPQDLKPFKEKAEKMISNLKKAVESLRAAADKLDDVWGKHNLAHLGGTSATIVGGLLTVGGGVATLMTAGVASPLLFAGLAFGVAGAGTNITAKIIESSINSNEIKRANRDMKVALDSIAEMKNILEDLLDKRGISPISHIINIADKSVNPTWKLLAAFMYSTQAAGKAGAQAAGEGVKGAVKASGQMADDVVQAGVKSGGQLAGKVIIGVSTVMLVWDVMDLSFTIYDLVINKGSEAAKELRKKADELEKLYISN